MPIRITNLALDSPWESDAAKGPATVGGYRQGIASEWGRWLSGVRYTSDPASFSVMLIQSAGE